MTYQTAYAITVAAIGLAGYCYVSEQSYRAEVESAERSLRLAEACAPSKPHERAEIDMRPDGSTQCAIYANTGYGRAPRLIFAEVREK